MTAYEQLKKRQQEEINAFPMHFAFGDEQIERKIKELKLSKDPKKRAEQIVYIGAGGFVLKEDYPALLDMFKRHQRERIEAMTDEENGAKYLYDMFRYELKNHEYGYTVDASDTLEALGITEKDLAENLVMKEAFEKAAADIRKEEGFEW